MNQKRPVNLDLATLKFPAMAIASILHRISGVILFLLLPFVLYFVDKSLANEAAFAEVKMTLAHPLWKLLIWGFGAALIYHLLAGFRHLMMDVGYGEHVKSGRRSAIMVITASILLTLLLGIWIW